MNIIFTKKNRERERNDKIQKDFCPSRGATVSTVSTVSERGIGSALFSLFKRDLASYAY